MRILTRNFEVLAPSTSLQLQLLWACSMLKQQAYVNPHDVGQSSDLNSDGVDAAGLESSPPTTTTLLHVPFPQKKQGIAGITNPAVSIKIVIRS